MPKVISTREAIYINDNKNNPIIGAIITYKNIRIKAIYFILLPRLKRRRTYTTTNLYNNIIDATSFSMVRKYINFQFQQNFNPLTGCVKETLKTYK